LPGLHRNRSTVHVQIRHVAFLLVSALMTGCAPGTNALVDTVRDAMQSGPGVSSRALNPAFRYLRVKIDRREVLLALGNVEDHPGGPVEVWYSAAREVLRMQNGRLVGAVGLTTEWREVSLPALPPWGELARNTAPFRWERVRDVMPGYRYGVRDALTLSAVTLPPRSELIGLAPESLAWFEERGGDLPPARYAVEFRDGAATVVYGEQCLADKLCFSWQRWTAQQNNPVPN